MAERKWRIRLGAELDFANILRWTAKNIGAEQARVYRDTLPKAIAELADGPDIAGSRVRTISWPDFARCMLLAMDAAGDTSFYSAPLRAAPWRPGGLLHDQMNLLRYLPFPAAKKKRP